MHKIIKRTITVLIITSLTLIMSCGGSSEVDQMLDEYEVLIDKYSSTIKQSMEEGEENYEKEMKEMQKELQNWSDKWQGKVKDLSKEDQEKFQKRMMEIAQKMSEMSNQE